MNCDPNTLVSGPTVDASLKPRFISYAFSIPPQPPPIPIYFDSDILMRLLFLLSLRNRRSWKKPSAKT